MNQIKLIEKIDNADFVIVPSKITKSEYEAGPLSLIEAMARKKICIVSDSIGFASYLDKNNCIIFESNNADDLCQKIITASKLSDETKKQISNNAFKTSLNFNFDKISKNIQEFLFSL